MQIVYEHHWDGVTDLTVMDTGVVCEPHFHATCELYYVRSGLVNTVVGGLSQSLGPGQLSFSMPYEIHSYHPQEPSGVTCLMIPACLSREFMAFADGRRLESPFLTDPDVTGPFYAEMAAIESFQNDHFASRGHLYLLLGLIAKHFSFADAKAKDAPFTLPEKLVTYLNRHYGDDSLTLTKTAADLGYNSFYISKFFNSFFGCSFSDYLNMLRLRQFISAPPAEGDSITARALDCGFNSIRTFNRSFKKEFGVCPTEYFKKTKLST